MKEVEGQAIGLILSAVSSKESPRLQKEMDFTYLDFFCSFVFGSISHINLVTSHSSHAVWMCNTDL